MKKTLFVATLLASALVAHAESLRVMIPAGYTANGVALPAGEYVVKPMKGSPAVLLLDNGTLKAFAFGRVMESSMGKKLTVELPKSSSGSAPSMAALKVMSAR